MNTRRVLITGASRGLGEAMAHAFAQSGARLLTPTRAELDLCSSSSVADFLQRHGEGVDVLINNAGINTIRELDELNDKEWAEMVQINLTAPMQLLQGCAAGMKARGWGRVLNVSSILALVAREGRISYSSVKAGLDGLTRGAALELAPHGVLVNSIAPGYIETQLTRQNNPPELLAQIEAAIPLRRLGQPSEIAACALWLCGETNTYLTGQTIVVDGGWTLR